VDGFTTPAQLASSSPALNHVKSSGEQAKPEHKTTGSIGSMGTGTGTHGARAKSRTGMGVCERAARLATDQMGRPSVRAYGAPVLIHRAWRGAKILFF